MRDEICLVTDIHSNIFHRVQQNKEIDLINDDRIFIFGKTIPLNCRSDLCEDQYAQYWTMEWQVNIKVNKIVVVTC